MALTRITKGVIKPNENYDTHNINSTGIVTAIGLDVNGNGDISGNLSVGGVLTYEDVTSIDSVGIITAQKDIHVGAGVSAVGIGTFGGLDINGDLDVDGHTELDNVNIAGVTTFSDGDIHFKNNGITSCRYDSDQGQFHFNHSGGIFWYKNGNLSNSSGATIFYSEHANQYKGLVIQAPWQGQNNAKNVTVQGSSNGRFLIQNNLNASETFSAYFQGGAHLGYYQSGTKLSTTTKGITVGTGVTIETNGQATFSGITTFAGNINLIGELNTDTARIRLPDGMNGGPFTGNLEFGNNRDFVMLHDGHHNYVRANNGNIYVTVGGNVLTTLQTNGTVLLNKDLDVDGHTNLDNVSVAGVTTFAQKINLSDNFIRNCRGFNTGNEQARIVVKAGDNSAGGGLRIVEYHNDDTTLFSSEIANFYTTGIELKENVSITGDLTIPDSITHSGDTNTKIRFPADDTIQFETSGHDRICIKSDGKIGVGTVTPAVAIHQFEDGNNGTTLRLENREGYVSFTNDADILSVDANSHHFRNRAGSTEFLRITSAGKIGVNYAGTPPAETMMISSTDSTTGLSVSHLSGGNRYGFRLSTLGGTNNGIIISRFTNSTYQEALRINPNGDVTTTGQASFSRQNAGFTARAGDAVSITRASGTPLEINRTGSDGQMITLWDDNTQEAAISISGGSLQFGTPNSNSARLTITSGGKIGINETAPFAELDIASSVEDSNGSISQHGIRLYHEGAANEEVIPISATFVTQQARARAGIGFISKTISGSAGMGGAVGFYTRNTADGHGLYTTDERARVTETGVLLVGHTSSPTSDADKLQVISTSSGTGICLHNYSASNYGNQIAFMKSRNNTIGSNTILNSGDRIGELNFYGNDGSGRSLGAQIQVRINGTPSNNNTPAAIYLNTGLNQSMQTRLSVLPAGTVGISKNGWSTSDHSFALTVHTGATSETGPVPDGIMIVSQQNSGNQNSTTGKLMFCGHAQTNGPFLYGDSEQAYGKKGLVFHTHSTANSYSTQLEETARFNYQGRFGLGTGTAVDSLMHIQGNSDDGDEACQLTIEDEDTSAGSRVPSVQFKGNGTNTWRIRGSDLSGFQFHQWNGSSQIERAIIGNGNEGGAFLLNADDRGWATFRHNHNQGLRTHIRRHYSPGNAVQTQTILRIRRHWWGWGTYKITCKALYYNSSLESVYYVNGHGSGGNNYSTQLLTYGGDASNQNWNCTVTHTASNNAPGNNTTWYADIQVNIPNYYYVTIVVEAFSSQYSTDPNNLSADSYCLM